MSCFNHNLTILVVGNVEQFLAAKPKLPFCRDTLYCCIKELTSVFLELHQPNVVLSPLVTSQFDIVELAVVLEQLSYKGQFRALAAPMPNPELILKEVKTQCPELDFDLITVRPNPKLVST